MIDVQSSWQSLKDFPFYEPYIHALEHVFQRALALVSEYVQELGDPLEHGPKKRNRIVKKIIKSDRRGKFLALKKMIAWNSLDSVPEIKRINDRN